jgi:hypothetical protein
MKQIYKLLYFAVMALGTLAVNAQGSAGANLSIELQSIQSIKINEGQSNVAIALSNTSEYINGKSAAQANHIEIMSSSDYEIRVSAATNLISESSSIDIGTVSITPTLGNIGTPNSSIELNSVPLSLGETTLVQSSQGDIKRSFNIEYSVSGGQAYLNKPTGIYSTVVTYTILAP